MKSEKLKINREKYKLKKLDTCADVFKYTNGITLITLVVTIIILIILAGVAINLSLGENGIFNKTKDAKEKYEIASIKEEIQTEIIEKQAENEGNISENMLKEILKRYGVLSVKEEKLIDKTLTTAKGNYEIKVSDIFNGTTTEIKKVANQPDISAFDKTKTYYVTWNLKNDTYEIQESNNLTRTAPKNWYDYTAGVNQWANIKTTGGGNDCYWVWIPRYAYKITSGYHTNIEGTIDIVFLDEQTNNDMNGNDVTSNSYVNEKGQTGAYKVHPAFTTVGNGEPIKNANGRLNTNYVGNGGFGELTGIWVAKFEASSNNVSETTLNNDLLTTGGGNVSNLQVRVKPNVTSWREINVNNIFTVCRNLTQPGNSLENTSNLNSHMMKNTEWGAALYLSRSIYGINGRIWNNPYYHNKANSPVTGLCGSASDGENFYTTDISKTCKYNEKGGGNASTTGNVYGIYDMSRGAYEYTAGYLSEITPLTNYSILANADSKYKDVYAGTSTDRNINYNANTRKYGDVVYETSSGIGNSCSWGSCQFSFLHPDWPVFWRGGCSANGPQKIDAFYCAGSDGGALASVGFRPVLVICSSM